MPKAEKGSVKDIGKRIKAKGLQKLKFYCQMCEKQCRDANGFKCHVQSESHLRQMKIFSENATGIMDSYSKEFEKVFLDTLRMRHGTTKIMANRVYQEVIQDKHHVHMNATIWATLSDFCKYLGKTGKCVVEENERGWFITYIERDVAKMAREEALQRRLLAEQQAEKATQERMEQQRREQAELTSAKMQEATTLQRENEEETIKVAIPPTNTTVKKSKRKGATCKLAEGFGDNDTDDDDDDNKGAEQGVAALSNVPDPNVLLAKAQPTTTSHNLPSTLPQKGNKREADSFMDRTSKKARNEDANNNYNESIEDEKLWLYKGIVVRIINQDMAGGKYFRRKAVVDRVVSSSSSLTAEVTVLEPKEGRGDDITGDILQIHQDDLETVVPKQTGVKVRLLRGPHRGKKAKLKALDKATYTAQVKVDDVYLDNVDFADFAQIA